MNDVTIMQIISNYSIVDFTIFQSSFNIIVSLYHGREYFQMGRRLILKLLIIIVN